MSYYFFFFNCRKLKHLSVVSPLLNFLPPPLSREEAATVRWALNTSTQALNASHLWEWLCVTSAFICALLSFIGRRKRRKRKSVHYLLPIVPSVEVGQTSQQRRRHKNPSLDLCEVPPGQHSPRQHSNKQSINFSADVVVNSSSVCRPCLM